MRKHNRNIVVKFLPVFTVDELKKENPDIVDITLRYKIEQAEKRGSVKKIGKIKTSLGRPKNVYVKNPVDKKTTDEIKKRNVVLI